jgi:hypothetical protein
LAGELNGAWSLRDLNGAIVNGGQTAGSLRSEVDPQNASGKRERTLGGVNRENIRGCHKNRATYNKKNGPDSGRRYT